MAKKKAAAKSIEVTPSEIPEEGAKIRKLVVKNLGCIGSTPVEIDLDEIVVLVGKNNTGKSTILRAYDVLFSSSKPTLTIDDFPESRVDRENLPQIELHTKVSSKPPGNRWIAEIEGENIVKERWTFDGPNVAGQRQGASPGGVRRRALPLQRQDRVDRARRVPGHEPGRFVRVLTAA